MAYMVTLNPADIDFGQQLASALKSQKFPYCGVFWLFDENSLDWQLVVATDLVDRLGPRKTYLELSKATKAVPASDFQLLRISVMSPKHAVYEALRSVFGEAASVQGARLQNTNVNGLYLTAHLYEIK